jgi:hypothetical protein
VLREEGGLMLMKVRFGGGSGRRRWPMNAER